MCPGTIYWSDISHVVYGTSAESLGKIAGVDFVVPSRMIFANGSHKGNLEWPLCEESANKVYQNFW